MEDNNNTELCISCTGIMWDVDDDVCDDIDLPVNIVIINPTPEMIADYEEENDAVVNYLSDKFGFCIKEFSMHISTPIYAYDKQGVIIMKNFELPKLPKLSENTKKVLWSILAAAIIVISLVGLFILAVYLLVNKTVVFFILLGVIVLIGIIAYVAFKIYEEFF